jgi:hypothetical protein
MRFSVTQVRTREGPRCSSVERAVSGPCCEFSSVEAEQVCFSVQLSRSPYLNTEKLDFGIRSAPGQNVAELIALPAS